MSTGNVVKNFLSKILKSGAGESSDECVNSMEIEFHGQFPIEENSLNGLCLASVYLPEEIILNIFVYLKPKDILNCSLVCKRWCNIAKSNSLWHTIYNTTQYPRKAKKLPWYVFYNYFTTNNFKNLLKNGNGQEQFKYWSIVLNGGSKFVIEDPPAGSDLLPERVPEFNGYTSCFATSYQQCSKYQQIGMSNKRLLRYIIKKYQPTLYLSEWYSARFDCACVYRLTVRCDTRNRKWQPRHPADFTMSNHLHDPPVSVELNDPIYLKSEKVEIEQWAGKEWKKMELTTQSYPSDDIENIYFCHEGQDSQFWAGHYGSKMAGGVIKFLFDSIEPAVDDSDDIEAGAYLSGS